VVVHEKYCYVVPDDLTDTELVCLPSQYLTAYLSLFDFGNLRPNQSVLIHSCVGKFILVHFYFTPVFEKMYFCSLGSLGERDFLVSSP
jgi:NADPH:quinone reductase and related Zn-dependent oxidoreductases